MHFWYQVGNLDAKSHVLSLFLVLQTTKFVTAVENNSKKWTKPSPVSVYISLFQLCCSL